MIISINQPAYLPWLGYFNRIAKSDLHIVLDHVQYEKNSFTNRNRIRSHQGPSWLTIPLKTKGRFGSLSINSLEISENNLWRKKHWDSLRFSYAKSPFFKDYSDRLEACYLEPQSNLNNLLKMSNAYLLECLGIDTPVIFSSDLGITSVKEQLIIDLCKAVEADTYLSGPMGRNYLVPEDFNKAGIELLYHDYIHPQYYQFQRGEFIPQLSVVDLLFNEGMKSRRIINQ